MNRGFCTIDQLGVAVTRSSQGLCAQHQQKYQLFAFLVHIQSVALANARHRRHFFSKGDGTRCASRIPSGVAFAPGEYATPISAFPLGPVATVALRTSLDWGNYVP